MEQVRNEQTIYSAAVYCRLSKDDEQAGESVSIETQKMMLTDFCHERGFSIYEIYADDGYSGLNFNRPAFTRLLEDIDNGKVLKQSCHYQGLEQIGQRLYPNRLLHRRVF